MFTRRRAQRAPGVRLAFWLTAAVALAAATARADIVIGVAGPMSGNFAILGEQMRAGAEQAVADINRDGGVNGQALTLEVMDDGCDAKRADAIANQLAGRNVALVVGHLCLGASLAASSVYAANRIVQISPGTTFAKFTDERPGPGVFRLGGRDDQQGRVAGDYLASQFADRNIAIVNDNRPYGKALADATRRAMNAAGKREAFTETFEAGGADYAALAARLKAGNIDVVYVGAYAAAVGEIARALRVRGATTAIVAGDALVTEEFWRIAGEAGEGTRMTYPPDARNNPEAAEVVPTFRDMGVEPEGYVLPAYAAVQVWAAAAAAAQTSDFDEVVAAISDGPFATVLGEVTFDERGDASLPSFVFYQWSDGRYDGAQM